MAITRSATARYDGTGKDGKGAITTQSGVLTNQRYGYQSRFEDGPGTNPEELIAAAHAGCFTMALSFALAAEGITDAKLETTARVKLEQEGANFTITRSDLQLTANVPGLAEDRFRAIAEDAKKNCPVSKLLDAEMDLAINVTSAAPA